MSRAAVVLLALATLFEPREALGQPATAPVPAAGAAPSADAAPALTATPPPASAPAPATTPAPATPSTEAPTATPPPAPAGTTPPPETLPETANAPVPETWGAFEPGRGFKVAKGEFGELNYSLYLLARYLNQLPATQTFTDHLGQVRPIDTRNDIQLQREMMFFHGWVYDPRLRYTGIVWTVVATAQVAVGGNISYTFGPALAVSAGYMTLPATRSMLAVWPYFFGTDRTMADDFFRPGFTSGISVAGQIAPGFRYQSMLGDNLSELGITAGQLTRSFATSTSVWIMPTTGEFGPRGGFGDYELHQRVATRFGGAYVYSRENRFSQPSQTTPDNTQIRLTDSLLLFETGSLAPGVTVIDADYNLWSVDAGMKYRGFALHAEYYFRYLTNFFADGALPLHSIFDHGFYVQSGYQLVPQRLELYAGTSHVFGPLGNGHEYIGGLNVYPFHTRNYRLNGQFIWNEHSSASSLFGYYVGGQTGPTISIATDVFF